jgi:lysophospholipase L1-like esterase
LYPNVFWILIGTNDLGGERCTEDAIVAGNIGIVTKLRLLRPNATVVINSLLPRPPYLWSHLAAINDRLYCYAAVTPHVEFFNATSIFMNDADHSLLNLMDELHPTAEGSMVWGQAIVDMVLDIIETTKR